jgi:hypothetical protein
MGSHWAIAVGISQYSYMESLQYAHRDAESIRSFLTQHSAFEQVYYLSDISPDATLTEGVTIPTQPTLANLKRFLQIRFATPFLKPEDTLWFFFSGHGLHYANRDYLLPSDANPENAEAGAIPVDDLADCLKRSGTNRIVLILDACHTQEQKFGQGFGTDPVGVTTLFGSSFNQTSYEIEALEHGSFTYALLTGLEYLVSYRNVTLEHLVLYLSDLLPKLNHQYGKPPQAPRIHAEAPFAPDIIPIPPTINRKPLFQRLIPGGGKAAVKQFVPLNPFAKKRRSLSPLWLGVTGVVTVLGIGAGIFGYWNSRPPKPSAANSNPQTNAMGVQSASPASATSSQKSPSLTAASSFIRSSQQKDTSAPGASNANKQTVPRIGTYYAKAPELGTSRREISRKGDRSCIKIVNGTAATILGYQPQVLFSSLSRQQSYFAVDATGEKLQPDAELTKLTDGKSTWQWSEATVDRSALMAQCLAAEGRFVRQAAQ